MKLDKTTTKKFDSLSQEEKTVCAISPWYNLCPVLDLIAGGSIVLQP